MIQSWNGHKRKVTSQPSHIADFIIPIPKWNCKGDVVGWLTSQIARRHLALPQNRRLLNETNMSNRLEHETHHCCRPPMLRGSRWCHMKSRRIGNLCDCRTSSDGILLVCYYYCYYIPSTTSTTTSNTSTTTATTSLLLLLHPYYYI